MKISLNWLKDYIEIDKTTEEISALLTQSGLEVEGLASYEEVKGGLKGLVVGEVLTCEKHPNADKLSVTTVDIGGEIKPIVCGAPNVAAGQKVIVATEGTTLYSETDSFVISKTKIRGELSLGMICAEDELGLGVSHDGIIVLDDHYAAGTPAIDVFDVVNDEVLEIGLTPNRADGTSHVGVARDLKAMLGQEVKWPDVSAFKIDDNSLSVEVDVKSTEACPRYAGLTLSGIKVAESPKWIQNYLKAIGLSPVNNVVDVTNFVLHELGQPLHAFDMKAIPNKKIVVDLAKTGTEFVTLDEEKRTLLDSDLVISNDVAPMCIAGVFGGLDSGVSDTTTEIFLESAYFSANYVRKTSMKHGLKTDASFRFERGTDPEMPVLALKRAAMLIKEIAGGIISSEIVDIYPVPIKPFEISVTYKNINRLIGKDLPVETVNSILISLDIELSKQTSEGFLALVPPYRVDVTREADIVEEVLRIYGYNNIEIDEHLSSEFISAFPEKDKNSLQLKITELLAASGFNEMMTNSLTNPVYVEGMKSFSSSENVEILNKLSEELGVMRQSLLFTGLEVVNYNINRRQKNLKLFEFGRTYKKAEGYQEEEKLAVFMTGDAKEETWTSPVSKVSFSDIHLIVNKILSKFNCKAITIDGISDDVFEYGSELSVNGKMIAKLGALKKQLLKKVDITEDVFFLELSWSNLLQLPTNEMLYVEVPKFPEVRRDLSLVIDKAVSFKDIKVVAERYGKEILRSINVFDVYEGDKIAANKKAYAISLTLQDKQKTLTDKVIDKAMNKLMKSFEKELGAEIRK